LTASVSARPRDFTDNRPMRTRRWILWQGLITPSMERFIVGASNVGFEFSGLILQAHEESPYVVRYAIEVDAAWVRFPSLEVQRLEQRYECLAERRYRYRSARFTADLAVDDDGMVLQYGVNWKAVATSGELA
jgi:hypothetical protein